jgi:hypothetical protein
MSNICCCVFSEERNEEGSVVSVFLLYWFLTSTEGHGRLTHFPSGRIMSRMSLVS